LLAGCTLKELIESRHTLDDLWDFCSVFLGTGNLFVWLGTLRYLGFVKAYNVLILTMKMSFPHVLRFLSVAMLVYCGFMLAGWIVLGPYAFKFRTIMSTSECLFSLINGDDMFATFSSVREDHNGGGLIYYYGRVYLYVFISLFIYVILSLFIAIIMDNYELLKAGKQQEGQNRRMHDYYKRANYDAATGVFREGQSAAWLAVAGFWRRFTGRAESAANARVNGHAAGGDLSPLVT